MEITSSGRYVSEFSEQELLGRGGFGSVYKAVNRLDGQHYAIKKINLVCTPEEYVAWRNSNLKNESSAIESSEKEVDNKNDKDELDSSVALHPDDLRIIREVGIFAQLSTHPNVVRYYNSWVEIVETDSQKPKTNSINNCDIVNQTSPSIIINEPTEDIVEESRIEHFGEGIFFFEEHDHSEGFVNVDLKRDKKTPITVDVKQNIVERHRTIINSSSVTQGSSQPSFPAFSKLPIKNIPRETFSTSADSGIERNLLLQQSRYSETNPIWLDEGIKSPTASKSYASEITKLLKSSGTNNSDSGSLAGGTSNLTSSLQLYPKSQISPRKSQSLLNIHSLTSSASYSQQSSPIPTSNALAPKTTRLHGALWASGSETSSSASDPDHSSDSDDDTDNEDLLFDPFSEKQAKVGLSTSFKERHTANKQYDNSIDDLVQFESENYHPDQEEPVKLTKMGSATSSFDSATLNATTPKSDCVKILEAQRDAEKIGIWVGAFEKSETQTIGGSSSTPKFGEGRTTTPVTIKKQEKYKFSKSCPERHGLPNQTFRKHTTRRASADLVHPIRRTRATTNPSPPALESSSEGELTCTKNVMLYIVMQLCSPTTLQKWIQVRNNEIFTSLSDSVLTPEKMSESIDGQKNIFIFRQIVQGLAHVHASGFIHRDIKPANIFVEPSLNILIGDFGLAKDIGCGTYDEFTVSNESREISPSQIAPELGKSLGADQLQPELTSLTKGIGTLLYASPEQLGNRKVQKHVNYLNRRMSKKQLKKLQKEDIENEVESGESSSSQVYDTKTDIYSLGVVLFELFWPFKTASERIATITDLRNGNFPPEFESLWPIEYSLLTRLLAQNPHDRPTAFEILADELLAPEFLSPFTPYSYRTISPLHFITPPEHTPQSAHSIRHSRTSSHEIHRSMYNNSHIHGRRMSNTSLMSHYTGMEYSLTDPPTLKSWEVFAKAYNAAQQIPNEGTRQITRTSSPVSSFDHRGGKLRDDDGNLDYNVFDDIGGIPKVSKETINFLNGKDGATELKVDDVCKDQILLELKKIVLEQRKIIKRLQL
ncbi:Eukaryotic translation initiation factor 2-alpha kinase [Nowakowskiella sp. JEL0407]|nr:Eukaryotic translation initiation factor 2-alpha kinase [Nowakowskiella sp. JEL0407]